MLWLYLVFVGSAEAEGFYLMFLYSEKQSLVHSGIGLLPPSCLWPVNYCFVSFQESKNLQLEENITGF